MKKLLLVLSVLTILVYILWYNTVYIGYIGVEQIYRDITNILIYFTISVAFFVILEKEKKYSSYWYAYSAVAEFWGFLGINMVLYLGVYSPNNFNRVLVSLGAMLILNIAIAIKPVRNTINNYITQLLNTFRKWFC